MTLSERAQSRDLGELLAVAADAALPEEIALLLLTRHELPPEVIEALAKNAGLRRHRKVSVAIASHPRAPRHICLPLIRNLYVFELVKIALLPAVPADVKIAIEEAIIARLEQVSEGERLTLAKQGPGRVAGALLLDVQDRIRLAALNNPKMTEALVLKALARSRCPAGLVQQLCSDPKWSLRRDVRTALLRNAHTPLSHAIAFARGLSEEELAELMLHSELRPEIKHYLLHARREEPSD